MSFKIEFQSYTYFIDRATFALAKKQGLHSSDVPIEKSTDQLLGIQSTLLASKSISSKNLTKLEKLIQTIESALEAQRAKEFWLFSNTTKLKELKAFHAELKGRLAKQESRELMAVQDLIENINVLSIEQLASFSNLYYSADAKVLQQHQVTQAKALSITKLRERLTSDEASLASVIRQLLLLEHTLSWLEAVCDEPQSESFFQQLIRHTSDFLSDGTILLPTEAHLKGGLLVKMQSLITAACTQIATAKIIKSSFCFIELLDQPIDCLSLELLCTKVQAQVSLSSATILALFYAFLKEVVRIKLYPQTKELVAVGLKELSKRDGEYRWYEKFFSNLHDLPFINLALEVLEKVPLSGTSAKIVARHMQIIRLKKAAKRILKIDSMSTAYQIECTISDSFSLISRMIKKKSPQLPLSLQRIAERGDLVILLKSKPKDEKPIIYVKSGFKKVTAGLLLPHDAQNEPMFVAQAVNLTQANQKYATFESIKEMRREVAIHQKFNGSRGIWPIISTCEYTKTVTLADKSLLEIPKLSCITPLAAHALDDWLKPNPPVMTTQELLKALSDLTHGLFVLHSAGYIHGDIKNSNILLSADFTAGFIDFGFSFRPQIDSLTGLLDCGYYGSRYCTAPEMLKKSSSDVDLFKAELFAFGVVILSLFLRQDPSWCRLIDDNIVRPFPTNVLHHILKCLQTNVEEPYGALFKKKKRTLMEELQLFTYSLLRIHPEERFTTLQAKEAITSIAAKFATPGNR